MQLEPLVPYGALRYMERMNHIEEQIRERKAASAALAERASALKEELAQLETQRLILDAELRAYEDALAHAKPRVRTKRPTAKSAPRKRALSEIWQCVLGHLAESFPEQVSGEDIRAWAELNGHDISPENLRSQMSLYKSKGWIASDEPGHYALTESGAQWIGVKLNDRGSGATQGSSDTDAGTSRETRLHKPNPFLSGTSLSGLPLTGLHGFQSSGGKT